MEVQGKRVVYDTPAITEEHCLVAVWIKKDDSPLSSVINEVFWQEMPSDRAQQQSQPTHEVVDAAVIDAAVDEMFQDFEGLMLDEGGPVCSGTFRHEPNFSGELISQPQNAAN